MDFSGPYLEILRTFFTFQTKVTQIPENECLKICANQTCAVHLYNVAKGTCVRVTRESTGNKNTGYQLISEHFQSIIPCFPEHLFSLDFIYFKALKADIFRSCSIKNQGLSRTQNKIQVLSRP